MAIRNIKKPMESMPANRNIPKCGRMKLLRAEMKRVVREPRKMYFSWYFLSGSLVWWWAERSLNRIRKDITK